MITITITDHFLGAMALIVIPLTISFIVYRNTQE